MGGTAPVEARAEGPRAVEQVPTTPDRKAERKEQPGPGSGCRQPVDPA